MDRIGEVLKQFRDMKFAVSYMRKFLIALERQKLISMSRDMSDSELLTILYSVDVSKEKNSPSKS